MAAFAVTMSPESQALVTRLIERRVSGLNWRILVEVELEHFDLTIYRRLLLQRMTGAPRRLTASVSSGNAPAPIVPRNLKKIKLLELDPTEIARQFTIKDSKLFLKITPEECLSKAWPKKFNREMPNFKAITDMSNAVRVLLDVDVSCLATSGCADSNQPVLIYHRSPAGLQSQFARKRMSGGELPSSSSS